MSRLPRILAAAAAIGAVTTAVACTPAPYGCRNTGHALSCVNTNHNPSAAPRIDVIQTSLSVSAFS